MKKSAFNECRSTIISSPFISSLSQLAWLLRPLQIPATTWFVRAYVSYFCEFRRLFSYNLVAQNCFKSGERWHPSGSFEYICLTFPRQRVWIGEARKGVVMCIELFNVVTWRFISTTAWFKINWCGWSRSSGNPEYLPKSIPVWVGNIIIGSIPVHLRRE